MIDVTPDLTHGARLLRRARRAVLGICALALLTPAVADAQSIAVRSTQFVVDSGDGRGPQPKFLLFMSYFDATRSVTLEEDLEYIRTTLKFDGIRIFPIWQDFATGTNPPCTVPSPDNLLDLQGNVRGDTTPPSGPLLRLMDVIQAAGQRGLMVDVSFTRDTSAMTVDNYIRGVTRVATLLRPFRNALFDLQNERDKPEPQFLSPTDTKRLRDLIVANPDPAQGDPGRVLVASGGGATADAVTFASGAALHANAYHDPRDPGWQDRTAGVVTELLAGNKPVYLQEPIAWDAGLTFCGTPDSARSDRDPAHFRKAARDAKVAGGAAWTFHTRQGFKLNGTSLKSRIQADAIERDLLEGSNTSGLQSLATEINAAPWPVDITVTVDLTGPGTGTVTGTSAGGGLTCSSSAASCSAPFRLNDLITFTATPAAGMIFLGWGGACSQAGACTVTVQGDQILTATFGVAPQLDISYYDLDALGSVRAVTDHAGTPVRFHEYFPFGEGANPAAGADALRFTGQERDAETGLDYFGARYYGQVTGRFTTADPDHVGGDPANPQSWNGYAYALNNPLRFVDPKGTCSQDANGNYFDSDDAGTLVATGPCVTTNTGALTTGLTETVTVKPRTGIVALADGISIGAGPMADPRVIVGFYGVSALGGVGVAVASSATASGAVTLGLEGYVPFSLTATYAAGVANYQAVIREIEELAESTAGRVQLMPYQIRALLQNVQDVINKTVQSGRVESLRQQASLDRWKFLDQLPPEAQAALRDAMAKYGITIP